MIAVLVGVAMLTLLVMAVLSLLIRDGERQLQALFERHSAGVERRHRARLAFDACRSSGND